MNFENNISSEDRQRVDAMRNPPEYSEGFDTSFEGDSSGAESGLDDLEALFSDSASIDFGGGGQAFGGGNQMGGGNDAFVMQGNQMGGGLLANQTGFGQTGFGTNPFGQQQTQQPQQKDGFDTLVEGVALTGKTTFEVSKEVVNSIKLRNADDIGYLSRNIILTGAIMSAASIVVGVVGTVADIKFISFRGLVPQLILAGCLCLSTGLSGMGTAALVLAKFGDRDRSTPDSLDELPAGEDNFTDDYEQHSGDILDDLFGDDFELDSEDEDDEEIDISDTGDDEVFSADSFMDDITPEPINFEDELAKINENSVISRQTLFETFKPMLPSNTPKFATIKDIPNTDNTFSAIETVCIKALANLANCQLEEVNSKVESIRETMFSYEIRLKRINKVKKTEDLAREIEVYMRDSSDDDSVNATVSIEGDFYKIIVTKGTTAVVTFGDVFKQQYCCDFYLDNKKKLPMVTGIDELGKVILDDAKNFDTMLIAGKPRSGKSWYVLSILISLMLFNSPESVQFLIIDPKKSNLFKTLSLMPHVFGLHDDSNILKVLDDVISIEAPRRKELLENHRCDDIWALREKGIPLPILYIVIDEYITVINNLDKDEQKEFDTKFQIIISQLPSLGIRLAFIPHRATGIVNRTNRTMIQYTCAIRSDIEDVKDTLGISKWDRALTKPGDIAVKHSMIKNAVYVRGAALTTSDGENSKFIETAAKAFYKMGVDIPDMSNMRIAYNRDERWIQQELSGNGNRVQFNAQAMDYEADRIDLSAV